MSNMSDSPSPLQDAVLEGDARLLRQLLLTSEFVLLSTAQSEEDPDLNVGAITAEIEDIEVLIAFTSEKTAGEFVQESGDLFASDESVDGVVVDGEALLEYLPDGFGILMDPESDSAIVIEPGLLRDVKELGP
jgi:hypothetical protein